LLQRKARKELVKRRSLSEDAGATVNLTLSKSGKSLVHVTGSYDACWCKRSHMHHGSATAGTGVVFGERSKKVILHGIRCTDCDACLAAKGKKKKEHYCSRNWHQSAKAMEADIAVQCFLEAPDHGMIISTLIGDEDSSVQKRIRDLKDIIGEVEKRSDFTHIKRNFGNQLYNIVTSFKAVKMERGTKFTADKVKRLQTAFRMAVKSNAGDWESLQKNLRTIVPHYYGEHTQCGDWCKGNRSHKKPFLTHLGYLTHWRPSHVMSTQRRSPTCHHLNEMRCSTQY
jgi:hypothetical protein